MSYVPGPKFMIEYVPSPSVLVEPLTIPPCNASTNAPLMGTPLPARVTVPITLPDVVVKVTLLLAIPLTVTTTGPVLAPAGTGTPMLLLLQLVGVATTPLKVTVLRFCIVPKLDPLIVIGVPIEPVARDRFAMFGCGVGSVTLMRESNPFSIVSSPLTRVAPGLVVRFTPSQTKNRSVAENVTAEEETQVNV